VKAELDTNDTFEGKIWGESCLADKSLPTGKAVKEPRILKKSLKTYP
jgi:hypothetical protein